MSERHTDRMRVLRAKLAELGERDRNYNIRGARYHRYQSLPAELDDVRTAEARTGYSLPDQYRDWLLEVGYGAGPDWGLLPLVAERHLQIQMSGTTTLHKQPMIFDLSAEDRPYPIGEIADISELTPEDCADRIKRDQTFVTAQSAKGLLAICEADYGSFDAIVAAGPMRGAIVHWLFDLGAMVYPETCGAGFWFGSLDYFTWMETWLDRSLDSLQSKTKPPRW
jgi:hypothetical protein